MNSASPEHRERQHQHQLPLVEWDPPVPICVLSGRRPVSIEEREGPQTAIWTYECCMADPPPSRKKRSICGVSTSGELKERPNWARKSSTATKSTFMAPGGGGIGGGSGGTGAGGGGGIGAGGSFSHHGSLHHQWCPSISQVMRVHGGAPTPADTAPVMPSH